MVQLKLAAKEERDILFYLLSTQEDYWKLPNVEPLNEEKIEEEYFNDTTETYFVMLDETYIGVMNVLLHHKRDQCPWIGLLLIHPDYEGYGFGTSAVTQIEEQWRSRASRYLLGVLPENEKGKRFWEGVGCHYMENRPYRNGEVLIYEKKF